MTESLTCVRCHRKTTGLEAAPFPGELGAEILSKVCADCWTEWQGAEVMVINELRLNFMDPRSQETLNQHMREFLFLDGPPAAPHAD